MNPSEAASALHILLGLVLLIWFIYGPWQALVCDGVRQRLFESRDELFDLAMAGEISFDDPAYKFARNRINAHIRFAHRASIWRMMALSPFVRRFPDVPDVPRTNAKFDEKLRGLLKKCDIYMVALIWLRSPILLISTMVIAITAAWSLLLNDALFPALKKGYARFTARVDQEAIVEKSKNRSWIWQQ